MSKDRCSHGPHEDKSPIAKTANQKLTGNRQMSEKPHNLFGLSNFPTYGRHIVIEKSFSTLKKYSIIKMLVNGRHYSLSFRDNSAW